MANSIPTWVSVVVGVVGIIGTVFAAYKAVLETKNLRRRDVKELLDLLAEARNRFEKESASAWRDPGAKPPKGSFEDSLANDLLVSQIFGRAITWSDYREIRKFLMDHENVRINDLRYAWPYRDQKQAPRISFQMTLPIWLNVAWYFFSCWVLLLLIFIGLLFVQISLNVPFLAWLISLSPEIPKLLISFGIHNSHQLLRLGAKIIPVPLVLLILNAVFNYGGNATRLICKKTKSLAKEG